MSRLTEETNPFGDEIDLGRYVQILVKHWYWILAPAIVAAVIAAGLSFFVLPQSYEATALVAISSPKYLMQFSEEFRAVVQERLETEIFRTFPELAKSDEMIQKVSDALTEGSAGPQTDLRGRMTVESTKNLGIIRLTVRDEDPALAAQIVNTWAELYVRTLNRLYGGEEQDYSFFEGQLAIAKQDQDAALEALAEFSATDPSIMLTSELEAKTAALDDYLATKNTIEMLEQKIRAWRQQLGSHSGSQTTSPGDELTSVLMQLQAFGILNGGETLPLLQISLEPIGEGRSTTEQIAFLDSLERMLRSRSAEIDSQIAELQPEILRAQYELQQMDNENSQLKEQVRNTTNVYDSLYLKTEEARIASESQVGVSRLASRASEPIWPTAPRKLVNTAVGAGLGLVIGLALVVIIELVGIPRSAAKSHEPDDGR